MLKIDYFFKECYTDHVNSLFGGNYEIKRK